jgi:aminoglycoside phosphotransferase family enzyme
MAAATSNDEVWSIRRGMVRDLMNELHQRALAAGDPREVRLIETHISWVLLGPDVYKVKKPVKLPFLDFSTFEAREQACRTEVRINRRLAPRTYQGVVPIRKRADGRCTFGAAGSVVDWAVRMTRLDDAGRADVLLEKGTLTREHVDALAAGIAAFHADSPSTLRVARHGAPEVIERNVLDNFAALRDHVGRYVRDDAAAEIERWQLAFVRGHGELFERRMLDGAVRDGHGDLRLEHVFFHPEGTD